ncbi:hypothetical protein CK203_046562 [Vitis vinifera]|uniref:Retrotransposon gag domain-containing protein n=1 Tax=Vitis vinifera TaxID=29760 RepID=A0A438HLF1_VITVI|nr:hypothetical protein CK203_046562 [Vitis vinifera]
MFLLTAKDVWDVIRETYSDAENASQIFELKMRLWQMKQGDQEEWECTGDSVRFKKKMENERVFEFLVGMNRELDDVRSRVLNPGCCPPSKRSSLRCDERKAKGE